MPSAFVFFLLFCTTLIVIVHAYTEHRENKTDEAHNEPDTSTYLVDKYGNIHKQGEDLYSTEHDYGT